MTLPGASRVVALTFDAGANDDGVQKILRTLREKGAVGTFFLTGDFARRFPASVEAIAQAGYPIGNHTDTHPNLTGLPDAAIRSEVTKAAAAIAAAGGSVTAPLFRFPYGARNPRAHAVINSLGYLSVFWTVDTVGWKGTSGGQSVDSVVKRVMTAQRQGEIVLMHVGSHPADRSTLDADALGVVIDRLRARGYDFVTVPQALGLSPSGSAKSG